MHEEIRYPVCPHRNVPAAYQRFLGTDSGGFERFFPNMRANRADGTLLIARLRGRKAAGRVKRAARTVSLATGEFNSGLSNAWWSAASLCLAFALRSGRDAMHLIVQTATLLFGSRSARLPA